jgi:hypothetical protein
VDDRTDVEAWADSVLDQHRSTPRRANDPDRVDELPLAYRMALRRSGAPPPDPVMVERILRASARHRRFAAVESVFTIAGVVLLLIFVVVFLDGF